MEAAMASSRIATTMAPLLIAVGFFLSACAERVDYGAPAYAYGYPAYNSLDVVGWGGWHHGWDHGHWDGRGEVGHEEHAGWGHGLSGHASFARHGGGGGHSGGHAGGHGGGHGGRG